MRWWWPFGSVPQIEPLDLRARLQAGHRLQLLDVRSPRAYGRGHIDGARPAPLRSLPGGLPELGLDPAEVVVAICRTTRRSVPAVRFLRERGYAAIQLAGGMDRWRRNRFPEVGTDPGG